MSRQKGLSNIELMFALVVAATIIMAGFRQYQHYHFQKNVATIDASVKVLFTATQAYYFANCKGMANQKTINIQNDLVNKDFLANEKLIQDPFDSSNSLNAYSSKLTFNDDDARYLITVTFVFPSSVSLETVSVYGGQLNPSEISGNKMTWKQNVTATSKGTAVSLSPLVDDIDRFAREQTVKKGYDKFKPPTANDPCTLQ